MRVDAGVRPGDVVGGKYRIEAIIGRGGTSTVFRARQMPLDRLVAIKMLAPAALATDEYVTRLKREAHAASRIRSEHVVRVFDVGELPDGGSPYIVMEHVEGADLAAVLARRGPLPLDLAVECILQACEVLAETHAMGLVHRDLKPANLRLAERADGSPCIKVLDFGIARAMGSQGLAPLTDPGTVLGTPNYMAPEQMEAGDRLDGRSDIWALGAIFYELLVGAPPYSGESLPQLFVKILRSRTPKPSKVRDDVGLEVDAIVARCLAVDPSDRFATVADLAVALSSLCGERSRGSAERVVRIVEGKSSAARRSSSEARRKPPRTARPTRRDTLRRIALGATSSAILFAGAFGLGVVALDSRSPAAVVGPAPPPSPSPTAHAPTAPAGPDAGEIAEAPPSDPFASGE